MTMHQMRRQQTVVPDEAPPSYNEVVRNPGASAEEFALRQAIEESLRTAPQRTETFGGQREAMTNNNSVISSNNNNNNNRAGGGNSDLSPLLYSAGELLLGSRPYAAQQAATSHNAARTSSDTRASPYCPPLAPSQIVAVGQPSSTAATTGSTLLSSQAAPAPVRVLVDEPAGITFVADFTNRMSVKIISTCSQYMYEFGVQRQRQAGTLSMGLSQLTPFDESVRLVNVVADTATLKIKLTDLAMPELPVIDMAAASESRNGVYDFTYQWTPFRWHKTRGGYSLERRPTSLAVPVSQPKPRRPSQSHGVLGLFGHKKHKHDEEAENLEFDRVAYYRAGDPPLSNIDRVLYIGPDLVNMRDIVIATIVALDLAQHL
ncbi:hypothetical protein BC831DRAFT_117496 [Entophlyctis helioformis]|nr:hypothetical protein BC831DRAFT_117496 [Entophlyctis helioformis]